MDDTLQRYWRWCKNYTHHMVKKIPSSEKMNTFFKSKNARLAVILIIAAAIPLTVLGVQTVQDIRQNAATTLPPCDGSSGYKVEPLEVQPPAGFTASKTDGGMLDNELVGFGNGVVASSCTQSGNNITCSQTKANAKGKNKGDGKSGHDMDILTGGSSATKLCEWYTKDGVKPTPRPSGTRTTPTVSNCDGKISAVCNAETPPKPGINLDWKLVGGTGTTCSVEVKDKQGNSKFKSTKCEEKNQNIFNGIENIKDYTFIVSNGKTGCTNKTIRTVTTSCAVPATATPKPGTGSPTNTPSPGQPTPTPKAGTGTPGVSSGKCVVNLNSQNANDDKTKCNGSTSPRLTGDWDISGNGSTCKVTLLENGSTTTTGNREIFSSTSCNNTAWSINKLVANQSYTLKVLSGNCSKTSNVVKVLACPRLTPTKASSNASVQAAPIKPFPSVGQPL